MHAHGRNTNGTHEHGRHTHAPQARRRKLHLARLAGLLLVLGVALLAPPSSFAQTTNPFASASAQSGAIDLLTSLSFWVWIACGIGGVVWVAAYWFQAIIPELYNQMRGMLKTGVLIMCGFNLVLSFILSQAEAAKSTALPLHLAEVLLRHIG